MKITSKGRVTIPIHVRERLGLRPDTEVEIEIVGSAARIRKAKSGSSRGRRLVERMRGRGTVRMSTDEIVRQTRGTGRRNPRRRQRAPRRDPARYHFPTVALLTP